MIRTPSDDNSTHARGVFPSTCWSRILGPADAPRSVPDLEALAQLYWRPVYGYIRRSWAASDDDALDMTQGFFLWVIDSGFLAKADRRRGRFRGFLKTSLRNYMTDNERRRRSLKRGWGHHHVSLSFERDDLPLQIADDADATPEEVLDRLWRAELVEQATASLEKELRELGKGVYFDVFRDYFLEPAHDLDYKAVAERYGITTVNVSNYLTYAKKLYRAHLRGAVRETVSNTDEFHEEIEWLFRGVKP